MPSDFELSEVLSIKTNTYSFILKKSAKPLFQFRDLESNPKSLPAKTGCSTKIKTFESINSLKQWNDRRR